jgi:hypothetical protein
MDQVRLRRLTMFAFGRTMKMRCRETTETTQKK